MKVVLFPCDAVSIPPFAFLFWSFMSTFHVIMSRKAFGPPTVFPPATVHVISSSFLKFPTRTIAIPHFFYLVLCRFEGHILLLCRPPFCLRLCAQFSAPFQLPGLTFLFFPFQLLFCLMPTFLFLFAFCGTRLPPSALRFPRPPSLRLAAPDRSVAGCVLDCWFFDAFEPDQSPSPPPFFFSIVRYQSSYFFSPFQFFFLLFPKYCPRVVRVLEMGRSGLGFLCTIFVVV